MTVFIDDVELGNLADVDDSFATLPAGEYILQSIATELKDTKDGTGKFISVQYEVVSGEYAGRKIFESFNIQNNKQQTVDIAMKQIKQWVKALGGTGDERLTMALMRGMEGKEFRAYVVVKPDKTGRYNDQNHINKFSPASGVPIPRPATAPAAKTSPPPRTTAPVNNVGPKVPAKGPTSAALPWEIKTMGPIPPQAAPQSQVPAHHDDVPF